jgi:hypothetical protein
MSGSHQLLPQLAVYLDPQVMVELLYNFGALDQIEGRFD